MRFRKWPRPTVYEETGRKRSAFLTKQRREREALPLFADAIAASQHSVDEEMVRRADWWPRQQQDRRDERARVWRPARARLFAFDADLRRTIRDIWRTCPYPADPYSFADLLHQIAVGKVDPDRPPWKYHPIVKPRMTPDPATFAEAFRQIGRKCPEDGADELLFCGNLGAGILFLNSRRQPADHGREIDVRGVCTDANIALIRKLAEAADDGPVAVRLVERPFSSNEDGSVAEPHRLLILACSATKRRDPGWMPAIDRYDGPIRQTLRVVNPDRRLTRVAVLSARYGFRDATAPVEDYDTRLTRDFMERMIAGGLTTRWPRPPSSRKPDTYGDDAACQITSLSNHGTRPFTEVALVGGHLYLDVMRSFVAGFREMRCVTLDSRVIEINAGIGVMRQKLRAWLDEVRP